MAIRITSSNYGGRVSISSRGLGGRFQYGADSPPLLLDLYPNSAAAYSLRKISKTYTGSAIRVRRSSDNAETNIGFVNNALDTVALLAFCGAGNGFVTTWYDQSGNSRNAVQVTTANQPTIVAVGVLQVVGTKPAIKFNNIGATRLSTAGIISGSQQRTQIVVYKPDSTSGVYGVFGQAGGVSPGRWSSLQARSGGAAGDPYFSGYSADLSSGLATLNTSIKIGTFLYNGTVGYLWKNNTQLTSGNLTLNTNVAEVVQIGSAGDSSAWNALEGLISECILYTSNELSNISAINTNINSYYTIY